MIRIIEVQGQGQVRFLPKNKIQRYSAVMNSIEAALGELAAFSLFEHISKPELLLLCENGKIVTSTHRDVLFRSGESAEAFGVVMSGAYKLSRPTPAGEDVIVHFATPGDVVAAFIMAKPKPVYPVSVTAMGPSRFLKIPREAYLSQWKKNAELIFKIQNLLSSRMNLLQDQKVMSRAPLQQRVAWLLLQLIDRNSSDQDLILPLPITRREIAESLGASVEAVIRIMSDWSKQGILQTSEQKIEVLRPDKMIELLHS